MIRHLQTGHTDAGRSKNLGRLIRSGAVTLGGYRKARIFGLLTCPSGMRMKMENRVFFRDRQEAVAAGYRPCGRCMPDAYGKWKAQQPNNKRQ